MNVTTRVASFLLITAFGASPAIAQDVKKGEQVYAAQKCSMCHSLDGKGQARDLIAARPADPRVPQSG